MKKFFYVASVLLLLCQTSWADDYKDSNKYDIIDEASYAVFMYDLKNSLTQQFGRNGEADGRLRSAFVLGNLDLISLKKEMILNMQKEGFSLENVKLDVEKSERIIQPFTQAVDNFLPTVKSMELSDAFIYLYMQTPEFYGEQGENKKYSRAMLHNAKSIAISRFDNKRWFNQIADCYRKNSSEQDMVDTIAECSRKYQQLVTEETKNVLQQLQEYKNLFESLQQISPNKSVQRIQSKSGNSYLDVPER